MRLYMKTDEAIEHFGPMALVVFCTTAPHVAEQDRVNALKMIEQDIAEATKKLEQSFRCKLAILQRKFPEELIGERD